MPRFDVVFFDIGSTLIPSSELIARAAHQACVELERHHFIARANEFLQFYLQADASLHPPHISHIYSDARIVAKAEDFAGLSFDSRRIGFFLHAYRDALRTLIQPLEQFIALFGALEQTGVQRGIVSDGSLEGQSEVLFRLGLLPYVSAGLCFISETVGVTKSEPAIYQLALKAARVEPARALMIGDHLEFDIAVPQSIGMKAALLRAHKPPGFVAKTASLGARAVVPDYQFDNWKDLIAWLHQTSGRTKRPQSE